jgi:hypothetical protein
MAFSLSLAPRPNILLLVGKEQVRTIALPDIVRGLPSRQQLHRATVKRQFHSLEIRILENSVHAVVI